MCEVEGDGFITVYVSPSRHPLEERCADCQQWIGPDGMGHLNWCPFNGYPDFPRLYVPPRAPSTTIGE